MKKKLIKLKQLGSYDNYYTAWNLSSNGHLVSNSISSNIDICPEFYLTTDIYKKGGTGTYTDHYILK